ncbi:MAG: glycosyltransferase family 4 protein [Phycisphaerae bacterium]|nr:glycosyltransferase family 4 protein [Phycisphaerae bacterium]
MAGNDAPDAGIDAPPFTGHVLHVVEAGLAARWGPMLRQTLWALAESGLRTALLTNDADLIEGLHTTGVECHQTAHLTGWRGWRLRQILPGRFDPPPDAVHLWGTAGLSWVQRWADRAGIPLLIHALGMKAVERVLRRGLRNNQSLAVATDTLAAPLLQRFPAAARRCQTLPPAVALPFHSYQARAGPHTLGVLCVSHLDDTSGLDILLDAVAQLRRGDCDLQVVVIGDGPGAGTLWQSIRERKVNDCCVVIDEPKLWEKGLAGADVCVVPDCQRELWLAPLLAMGLGKLVIASRDQLADWFIEGRTAWQFTPGSAVELAYLLTRAREQPKHVRETTESAGEYFHEHHSIGGLVEKLITLYGATVSGGAS